MFRKPASVVERAQMPREPKIGNWKNGTSVLIDAVQAYRAGKELSVMEMAAFRGYLRDWMLGDHPGPEAAMLRRAVNGLRTPAMIERWLARANGVGLDPL
jgi:hypothetical protein